MLNRNHSFEDYDSGFNPVNRAIAVLERQRMDTDDLKSHVDCAREAVDARSAPRIRSLLTAMSLELGVCGTLLWKHIGLLSHGSARERWAETDSRAFWGLFQTDESDCSAHLDALLSGYVRYARATCDSIAFLQLLADQESVELLRQISNVADQGIWFIELYMEGLALHLDIEHLPEYIPAIGTPEKV